MGVWISMREMEENFNNETCMHMRRIMSSQPSVFPAVLGNQIFSSTKSNFSCITSAAAPIAPKSLPKSDASI